MMTRSFGLIATDFLKRRLTAVVLPTPVDPSTAKCRPINSLTSISAGMMAFWLNLPISTPRRPRKL